MHHKRKRSSTRREVHRMDNKSYRQQEARALENDDRGPANPRSGRWSYRPEPLPLGDVPCNGTSHAGKKVRKPKERCPVNGTHEWYKEWVVRSDFYIPWTRCEVCTGYVYRCYMHGERRKYTESVYLATCIHCWTSKKLKVENDLDLYGWKSSRRSRLRLKRRRIDTVSGMTLR